MKYYRNTSLNAMFSQCSEFVSTIKWVIAPHQPTQKSVYLFSKIGCWNFLAISPAVKQMKPCPPHTHSWRPGRLLADGKRYWKCAQPHQLISVTHVCSQLCTIKCTSVESCLIHVAEESRPNGSVVAYYG